MKRKYSPWKKLYCYYY